MASYHYDEVGNMAALFLLSFLALILIPLTLSSLPQRSKGRKLDGCDCSACANNRKALRKAEGGLARLFTPKRIFLVLGWALFAFVAHRVYNSDIENKIYNPFEILGLKAGVTEKEIKSHYKKLSKKFHPDKVRATANETIEMIQSRFVDFTKAYKSLTDPTIRENLEKYGHPDGRQELSMGIALPPWIIESQNNIWVLGFYGLIFGGALPAIVGRWWFGSRQRTKDGINVKSAAAFFTSLKEEASMEEIVGTLGKAYQWDSPSMKGAKSEDQLLQELEKQIIERAGPKYTDVRTIALGQDGPAEARKKALILIYSHLLRLELPNKKLELQRKRILLQLPLLLNAFLTISMSRNWLVSTLGIMRLHSYLIQGLLPTGSAAQKLAQLPGFASTKEAKSAAPNAKDLDDFVSALEQSSDDRVEDVKKAVHKWGRIELVDAQFKVIGERIITPNAIIHLVLKLRLSPPGLSSVPLKEEERDVEEAKKLAKINGEKDAAFLLSKGEAEELSSPEAATGYAHAPRWPVARKPSYWVVLAEPKSNRLVVPPTRIYDVPYSSEQGRAKDRDYRSYKIQFQGPNAVGTFGWKVFILSDTFVGEEVSTNLTLTVDDVSALEADEQAYEDEISDPDEDTLEGQMALMKGGKVRRIEESDDDESTTDGDESSGADTDSDSDSD